MFCSKCGSEIDNSARFCYKCGNAVSQTKQEYFKEYIQRVKAKKGKTTLLLAVIILLVITILSVDLGKGRIGTVLKPKEKESSGAYNTTGNRSNNIEADFVMDDIDNTQTSIPEKTIDEQKDEEFYINLYKTWASKAREYCLKPFGTADSMDLEDICIVYRIIEFINAEWGEKVSYTYNAETNFFEVEGRIVDNTLREKSSIIGYGEQCWWTYYNLLDELVYDEVQDKFFFNTLYEEVPTGTIETVDMIEMSSGFISATIYWNDGTVQQFLFDGENPEKIVSYEGNEIM